MKKLLLSLLIIYMAGILFTPIFAIEANNNFEIIPEAENQADVIKAVNEVGSEGGRVRDKYNQEAQQLKGVGNQLASGIMTRDTLLDYTVYGVRFLSQIGLVIGALMIIYAGYLYATTIFGGGDASKGKNAIKDAIIGVLIIAFSYAIMKLLTSALIT